MRNFHRSSLGAGLVLLSLLCGAFLAQSEAKSIPTKIAITSPKNDQKFTAPASMLVDIQGSRPGNVGGKIELYIGNQLVNFVVIDPIPLTIAVPFQIDLALNNVPVGRYVLTARLNGVVSHPVHIVVQPPGHH